MSRDNVDLIRRGLDAFARRDIAGWLECFDGDVQVIEDPSVPDAGSYQGHAGLMQWLHVMERNWDAFEVRGEKFLASEDDVLTLVRVSGRGRESGVDIDGRFASIFTVREGRVVAWRIYAGWEAALSAMAPRE